MAETFVEFARKQETRIGRDGGPAELDAKLGLNERRIEPDAASPT